MRFFNSFLFPLPFSLFPLKRHDPVRAEAAALAELATLNGQHVIIDTHNIALPRQSRAVCTLKRRMGNVSVAAKPPQASRFAGGALDGWPAPHIDFIPVGGAMVPVPEERDGIAQPGDLLVQRAVRPRMGQQEERADAIGKTVLLLPRLKGLCQFALGNAPLPPEEMIPLDLLVPYRLVLFTPYALPVRRHIGCEDMLRPLDGIGISFCHEASIPRTLHIVIADNEKFHRFMPIVKNPMPDLGMELQLPRLPTVRHVTAMHNRIDIARLEILQGRDKVPVSPARADSIAFVRRPEMRVAHDAQDQIGLPAVLPAFRRGEEETARQSQEAHRRKGIPYEVTTSHCGQPACQRLKHSFRPASECGAIHASKSPGSTRYLPFTQ